MNEINSSFISKIRKEIKIVKFRKKIKRLKNLIYLIKDENMIEY